MGSISNSILGICLDEPVTLLGRFLQQKSVEMLWRMPKPDDKGLGVQLQDFSSAQDHNWSVQRIAKPAMTGFNINRSLQEVAKEALSTLKIDHGQLQIDRSSENYPIWICIEKADSENLQKTKLDAVTESNDFEHDDKSRGKTKRSLETVAIVPSFTVNVSKLRQSKSSTVTAMEFNFQTCRVVLAACPSDKSISVKKSSKSFASRVLGNKEIPPTAAHDIHSYDSIQLLNSRKHGLVWYWMGREFGVRQYISNRFVDCPGSFQAGELTGDTIQEEFRFLSTACANLLRKSTQGIMKLQSLPKPLQMHSGSAEAGKRYHSGCASCKHIRLCMMPVSVAEMAGCKAFCEPSFEELFVQERVITKNYDNESQQDSLLVSPSCWNRLSFVTHKRAKKGRRRSSQVTRSSVGMSQSPEDRSPSPNFGSPHSRSSSSPSPTSRSPFSFGKRNTLINVHPDSNACKVIWRRVSALFDGEIKTHIPHEEPAGSCCQESPDAECLKCQFSMIQESCGFDPMGGAEFIALRADLKSVHCWIVIIRSVANSSTIETHGCWANTAGLESIKNAVKPHIPDSQLCGILSPVQIDVLSHGSPSITANRASPMSKMSPSPSLQSQRFGVRRSSIASTMSLENRSLLFQEFSGKHTLSSPCMRGALYCNSVQIRQEMYCQSGYLNSNFGIEDVLTQLSLNRDFERVQRSIIQARKIHKFGKFRALFAAEESAKATKSFRAIDSTVSVTNDESLLPCQAGKQGSILNLQESTKHAAFLLSLYAYGKGLKCVIGLPVSQLCRHPILPDGPVRGVTGRLKNAMHLTASMTSYGVVQAARCVDSLFLPTLPDLGTQHPMKASLDTIRRVVQNCKTISSKIFVDDQLNRKSAWNCFDEFQGQGKPVDSGNHDTRFWGHSIIDFEDAVIGPAEVSGNQTKPSANKISLLHVAKILHSFGVPHRATGRVRACCATAQGRKLLLNFMLCSIIKRQIRVMIQTLRRSTLQKDDVIKGEWLKTAMCATTWKSGANLARTTDLEMKADLQRQLMDKAQELAGPDAAKQEELKDLLESANIATAEKDEEMNLLEQSVHLSAKSEGDSLGAALKNIAEDNAHDDSQKPSVKKDLGNSVSNQPHDEQFMADDDAEGEAEGNDSAKSGIGHGHGLKGSESRRGAESNDATQQRMSNLFSLKEEAELCREFLDQLCCAVVSAQCICCCDARKYFCVTRHRSEFVQHGHEDLDDALNSDDFLGDQVPAEQRELLCKCGSAPPTLSHGIGPQNQWRTLETCCIRALEKLDFASWRHSKPSKFSAGKAPTFSAELVCGCDCICSKDIPRAVMRGISRAKQPFGHRRPEIESLLERVSALEMLDIQKIPELLVAKFGPGSVSDSEWKAGWICMIKNFSMPLLTHYLDQSMGLAIVIEPSNCSVPHECLSMLSRYGMLTSEIDNKLQQQIRDFHSAKLSQQSSAVPQLNIHGDSSVSLEHHETRETITVVKSADGHLRYFAQPNGNASQQIAVPSKQSLSRSGLSRQESQMIDSDDAPVQIMEHLQMQYLQLQQDNHSANGANSVLPSDAALPQWPSRPRSSAASTSLERAAGIGFGNQQAFSLDSLSQSGHETHRSNWTMQSQGVNPFQPFKSVESLRQSASKSENFEAKTNHSAESNMEDGSSQKAQFDRKVPISYYSIPRCKLRIIVTSPTQGPFYACLFHIDAWISTVIHDNPGLLSYETIQNIGKISLGLAAPIASERREFSRSAASSGSLTVGDAEGSLLKLCLLCKLHGWVTEGSVVKRVLAFCLTVVSCRRQVVIAPKPLLGLLNSIQESVSDELTNLSRLSGITRGDTVNATCISITEISLALIALIVSGFVPSHMKKHLAVLSCALSSHTLLLAPCSSSILNQLKTCAVVEEALKCCKLCPHELSSSQSKHGEDFRLKLIRSMDASANSIQLSGIIDTNSFEDLKTLLHSASVALSASAALISCRAHHLFCESSSGLYSTFSSSWESLMGKSEKLASAVSSPAIGWQTFPKQVISMLETFAVLKVLVLRRDAAFAHGNSELAHEFKLDHRGIRSQVENSRVLRSLQACLSLRYAMDMPHNTILKMRVGNATTVDLSENRQDVCRLDSQNDDDDSVHSAKFEAKFTAAIGSTTNHSKLLLDLILGNVFGAAKKRGDKCALSPPCCGQSIRQVVHGGTIQWQHKSDGYDDAAEQILPLWCSAFFLDRQTSQKFGIHCPSSGIVPLGVVLSCLSGNWHSDIRNSEFWNTCVNHCNSLRMEGKSRDADHFEESPRNSPQRHVHTPRMSFEQRSSRSSEVGGLRSSKLGTFEHVSLVDSILEIFPAFAESCNNFKVRWETTRYLLHSASNGIQQLALLSSEEDKSWKIVIKSLEQNRMFFWPSAQSFFCAEILSAKSGRFSVTNSFNKVGARLKHPSDKSPSTHNEDSVPLAPTASMENDTENFEFQDDLEFIFKIEGENKNYRRRWPPLDVMNGSQIPFLSKYVVSEAFTFLISKMTKHTCKMQIQNLRNSAHKNVQNHWQGVLDTVPSSSYLLFGSNQMLCLAQALLKFSVNAGDPAACTSFPAGNIVENEDRVFDDCGLRLLPTPMFSMQNIHSVQLQLLKSASNYSNSMQHFLQGSLHHHLSPISPCTVVSFDWSNCQVSESVLESIVFFSLQSGVHIESLDFSAASGNSIHSSLGIILRLMPSVSRLNIAGVQRIGNSGEMIVPQVSEIQQQNFQKDFHSKDSEWIYYAFGLSDSVSNKSQSGKYGIKSAALLKLLDMANDWKNIHAESQNSPMSVKFKKRDNQHAMAALPDGNGLCETLTHLNISYLPHAVSDSFARLFGKTITCLKVLICDGNYMLTSSGANSFISSNKKLQQVSFLGVPLLDDSFFQSLSVSANPTLDHGAPLELTSLRLSHISSLSAASHAGLCWARKLRIFEISEVDVLTDALLMSLLKGCSSLRKLNVQGCRRLTNRSLKSLFESNFSLTQLDVSHCYEINFKAFLHHFCPSCAENTGASGSMRAPQFTSTLKRCTRPGLSSVRMMECRKLWSSLIDHICQPQKKNFPHAGCKLLGSSTQTLSAKSNSILSPHHAGLLFSQMSSIVQLTLNGFFIGQSALHILASTLLKTLQVLDLKKSRLKITVQFCKDIEICSQMSILNLSETEHFVDVPATSPEQSSLPNSNATSVSVFSDRFSASDAEIQSASMISGGLPQIAFDECHVYFCNIAQMHPKLRLFSIAGSRLVSNWQVSQRVIEDVLEDKCHIQ